MGFHDSPLVEKLKKKSKNVLVFNNNSIYTKNLTRSGDRTIGQINVRDLVEFLNKFGRKLFIDDAADRLFDELNERWEIDFQLLYSGYLLFHENRTKFEETVRKCRNKKEFIIACGMR